MRENLEKIIREICFIIKVEGRLVLKNYPITPAQFDLLQRLYFRGPMKMTELSTHLGIAKSTLSGIVKRLEGMKYLSRERGKDKRVFLISITEHGKQIIEAVIENRVQFIGKVIEEFGQKKAEELYEILQQFKEAMEKCRSSR
ncbi:MarR family winged helix-turn-helix transcriptional regulator [Pseudothermotoga thermarum]|uniref:Transcriptional regulator, MarR family n=1 Tax=Pseudothermotoga thermarum DSM 5069 TaxID=688269 RepID=F7YVT5_9THEM|nr:MarR family transcriptional regulator [Pseudothermotoga thermarum]AEH51757.1 transcriptional regulator, MarR family [Pseudothermotoga thermarum DSM 5069]